MPKRIPLTILSKKTKNEAYWAGFLYADGSFTLTKTGRWIITLCLALKDKPHLIKFSKKYGTGKVQSVRRTAIKGGKTYPSVSYHLTSRIEPVHFKDWGIVRRKTWNWQEPIIPSRLVKDFLRGWFDGDGHLGDTRATLTNAQRGPLEWFCGKLKEIGYKGTIKFGTKNKGRHHVVLFDALEFFNLLKGSPRLERKWKKRPRKHLGANKLKTHCLHGHEFTEENTYRQKGRNSRSCLICRRSRSNQ